MDHFVHDHILKQVLGLLDRFGIQLLPAPYSGLPKSNRNSNFDLPQNWRRRAGATLTFAGYIRGASPCPYGRAAAVPRHGGFQLGR